MTILLAKWPLCLLNVHLKKPACNISHKIGSNPLDALTYNDWQFQSSKLHYLAEVLESAFCFYIFHLDGITWIDIKSLFCIWCPFSCSPRYFPFLWQHWCLLWPSERSKEISCWLLKCCPPYDCCNLFSSFLGRIS